MTETMTKNDFNSAFKSLGCKEHEWHKELCECVGTSQCSYCAIYYCLTKAYKKFHNENERTCKNCKWVKDNKCDFINTFHNEGDTHMDVDYETLDDSGLTVWLSVGPRFGCVNFTEHKEMK